jgi:hypothetical protein
MTGHPFYSEGPQGYSPHWGRTLLEPKTAFASKYG